MKTVLKGRSLILASGSPRRRQLLELANIPFSVQVFPVDESFPSDMIPEAVAEFIAVKKGHAHKSLCGKNTLVICADTIVLSGGEILGKAQSREEAKRHLNKLSGKQHQVITGVCILNSEKQISFSAMTNVLVGKLTDEEIHYYLEHFKPYDKAGAYGIQDWFGVCKVERIEGLYTNVMGLPVEMLYTELLRF